MSVQRSRPVDALQRIMTSFKHFEKKLDKLQDDVKTHGQTLSDLRNMVTTLSAGTLASDGKSDDNRRPGKKTTAIQYDEKAQSADPVKSKRKNAIQPLPNKLKEKGMQNQQNQKMNLQPIQVHVHSCIDTNDVGSKHAQRYRKAEVPRKAATIRSQKTVVKKRSKIKK